VNARLPSLEDIRSAAREVYAVMPATPQYCWPLLGERLGAELWVKHENHTPVGAFKVRGGIVYFNALRERGGISGVIGATRGNHGQSIAFNAKRIGIEATIVVPHGNSREKNAAMRGFGATVIEYGDDFQESLEFALQRAAAEALHVVPPFHPDLVRGVATFALEFLETAPPLDVLYAPVGMGTGVCGVLAARDALGLRTEVVAVMAQGAPAYALSLAAGHAVDAPANTIADGMACRRADGDALEVMLRSGLRTVVVSDAEIEQAMRLYFACTHNLAEGAGAASLAAALKDDRRKAAARVGVVLSGGNVDSDVFARVLS
jgi:threonine dehydratase